MKYSKIGFPCAYIWYGGKKINFEISVKIRWHHYRSRKFLGTSSSGAKIILAVGENKYWEPMYWCQLNNRNSEIT